MPAPAPPARQRADAMLKDIETYLKERGAACLADIALHLKADPEAVFPMLKLLAARGRIRPLPMPRSSCGSCTRCAPDALALWEWAGEKN